MERGRTVAGEVLHGRVGVTPLDFEATLWVAATQFRNDTEAPVYQACDGSEAGEGWG